MLHLGTLPYLCIGGICQHFSNFLQDEISWLVTRVGQDEMRRTGRYPPEAMRRLTAANTYAARRLPCLKPLKHALRGIRRAVGNVKARAFL